MTITTGNEFRMKYESLWQLVPVVQTWSLFRNDPTIDAADRSAIDGWLGPRVAFATEPLGGPGNEIDPFNAGYLSRALEMAWGVMTSNNAKFQLGIERFLMGLHQMRADGSFPREVARGACAFRYQAHTIDHMMLLGELAARQGYDLYALSVNGKTLHTAIKFLLDAVENPALMQQYASEDASNCAAPAELPFELSSIVAPINGVTHAVWLEPYIARFPNHANTPRLYRLLRGGLTANRPLNHPNWGGNSTCFSAGG
jgi:poly(beta-D-mannuronate) lyase